MHAYLYCDSFINKVQKKVLINYETYHCNMRFEIELFLQTEKLIVTPLLGSLRINRNNYSSANSTGDMVVIGLERIISSIAVISHSLPNGELGNII